MASWDDLVSYVRVRYEIMRQHDQELWFNLPTTGERTQLVVVRQVVGDDGHTWAQISSPICRVAEVDLTELLSLASASVVGGVVTVDGIAVFRHSVPLGDANLGSFDRPFRHVADVADDLEEKLTGRDEH
ncbi:hypothetical protein PSU4_53910 [Pseudonocardia sulfidoxydans NBRC 16205]|uniref:Uncharacterized protein n=1 Tax=Pseudonocardia sulfidoxydans NBRC 16205 TaxID=1223511 RepID=A0A511DQ09_9PSEU|nr:hypothetical protein [Pseudonocardia sulfidoxydans]GEL26437.1 hypothetical protein PSU4_53910 [Pseudonocardia sulfidoxydans NBRC 16205]